MSIRSRLVSHSNNNLVSNSEQLFNDMDLLPITLGVILSPNLSGKYSTNSQINRGISDENKSSKVRTIKILLDNRTSASIVRKYLKYKRHRILKREKE